MWASCRRDSDSSATRAWDGGFSLLELLVVLALISFMTALVAPRLKNTVDAISRSGERADAVRQLERLPLLARRDGTPLAVDKGHALSIPGLELPEGWSVQVIDRLRVAANGYCAPAQLEVTTLEGKERWMLGTPDCRISDAPL
ncbi:prepilin-type N-terminal cleavage/methylation domain-containing protein [Stenotrophomonas acidaminiphila]|jgi:prepilin-type N-terminal cleavage/methylation domain-containing protein|uniref:prepilin-type N-terminal cleavage/methylation domain-containing protein n=1 Tax=Stenotrophomonas acidaminiphila TaxID=128780 RepID=UPI0009EB9F83|nr:prepilin-type N-terminal cleavage/methylation domain-containing protein [Stenotrophomonas acidaminiphila]